MEKYISNLNNPIYKEYLDKLAIFNSYKIKILKKEPNESRYFKEDNNKLELKYNNMDLTIIKPIYKNIFKELENIKKEKKLLLNDYYNLRYLFIHDLNKESDYKKYKNIISKLKEYDENIKNLLDYYIKANESNKNEFKNNIRKRDEINKKKIELFNDIINEQDSILNKKRIIDYLELGSEYNETFNKYQKTIDFIIEELPEIKQSNIVKKKNKTEKKELKTKLKKTDEEIENEKKTKLKKVIKNKLNNTPKDKLDNLEEDIKEKLFKEFKFKNVKECADRSYRAKHYMKKPEIIDIIKKSKEIEKRMPKNYMSMSKDDICIALYKL
jgi:hypothetical protein